MKGLDAIKAENAAAAALEIKRAKSRKPTFDSVERVLISVAVQEYIELCRKFARQVNGNMEALYWADKAMEAETLLKRLDAGVLQHV